MMTINNLFIVLVLLILASCTSIYSKRTIYYAVKPGDTLYSIAWRYQTTYQSLAKLNKIKPPYVIRVDDVIKVRYQKSIKIATVNKTNKTKVPSKINTSRASSRQSTTVTKTSSNAIRDSVKNWQWPLNGPIVNAFGDNKGILKGIQIKSNQNSVVTASNSGEIVYSGSGLRSYGKLIIIKHNKDYLSAYGYLNKLNVKEGDSVKKGQTIAKLGVNQEGKPLLHFEIRYKGRPVDPINYLPKRN